MPREAGTKDLPGIHAGKALLFQCEIAAVEFMPEKHSFSGENDNKNGPLDASLFC